MYKHETTRRFESQTCPGVSIILRKMTEGRRLELRAKLSEANRKSMDILREQEELTKVSEDKRNNLRLLELQDAFDGLNLETINPTWIAWGVKHIEGLDVDGKTLGIEDWKDWPSALFDEVVQAVKEESSLNGIERKNSPSPTTSGEPGQPPATPSTVSSASGGDGGGTETADSTSHVM